jgi:hypothetical protein
MCGRMSDDNVQQGVALPGGQGPFFLADLFGRMRVKSRKSLPGIELGLWCRSWLTVNVLNHKMGGSRDVR